MRANISWKPLSISWKPTLYSLATLAMLALAAGARYKPSSSVLSPRVRRSPPHRRIRGLRCVCAQRDRRKTISPGK